MAFEKIKELKCFAEVHERVARGDSIDEVVEFIQGERGEYTNVTASAVRKALYRYRASLGALDSAAVSKVAPRGVWADLQRVQTGIKEHDEMEHLYRLQLSRVEKAFNTESQLPLLTKQLRAEIQVAAALLTRLVNIKTRMGIYKAQPSEHLIRGEFLHKTQFEKIPAQQRVRLADVVYAVFQKALKDPAAVEEADYEVVSGDKSASGDGGSESCDIPGLDQDNAVVAPLPGGVRENSA